MKRRNANKLRNSLLLVFLGVFLLTLSTFSTGQVKIGIKVPPLTVNESGIDTVNVSTILNSTENVSIKFPVSYVGSGLVNLSIRKPSDWLNGIGWYVLEDGVRTNITVVGEDLQWEANTSAETVEIIFNVPSPEIIGDNVSIVDNALYKRNITINAVNPFKNVSGNISINTSYPFWALWQYNGNEFEDKTLVTHLEIASGYATFHNISTSTKLIRLTGNITCAERWICTDWSDLANSCGTRNCTIDLNHCGTTDDKIESLICSATATTTTSGGGGGGGGAAREIIIGIADFELSDNLIRVSLTGDKISRKTITVENTGTANLDLQLDFSGVTKFVIILGEAKRYIELAPGEKKSFDILVFGSDLESGVYSGNIVVSGSGIEKRINVFLEYETEQPIFDIEIEVPERYSKIFPGDKVFAEIRLFNLGTPRRVDVRVRYTVKDSEDLEVASGSTVVAVETQTSFVRSLSTPPDAEPGTYVFSVVVEFDDLIGTGSDIFEVVGRPTIERAILAIPNLLLFGIGSLLVLLAVLITLNIYAIVHQHKVYRPKETKIKFSLGEHELRKQLKLLEESFESDLISARTYIEAKNKIRKRLKRIENNKLYKNKD